MSAQGEISLLELQEIIRDGVESAAPDKLWVKAEIASVQARGNGHCYLELAQSEDGRLIAKARAVIWKSVWFALRRYFAEATGSELAAGMQILARVQANYSELYEKMGEAAGEMAKHAIFKYVNGELKGIPQDESKVTFAEKISVEDEHLPLNRSVKETINYISGLSYEPGTYLYLGDKKLKVFKASLFNKEKAHEVGEIIQNKKHLLLQLKDGVISLDEIQLEGKKMMAGGAFLNGARLTFPCFLK